MGHRLLAGPVVFSQHSSSRLWGRDTRRFPERQAEHLQAVNTSARSPAQAQAGAAPPCELAKQGLLRASWWAVVVSCPLSDSQPLWLSLGSPHLFNPAITGSEALLGLRTCAVRLSSVGALVCEDRGNPCTRWQRGGGVRVLEGARRGNGLAHFLPETPSPVIEKRVY